MPSAPRMFRARQYGPAMPSLCFFFNDTATTEIYTLSLHDALPISVRTVLAVAAGSAGRGWTSVVHRRARSEEHTSELQSQSNLVCRLLLEKKEGFAGGDATPYERRPRVEQSLLPPGSDIARSRSAAPAFFFLNDTAPTEISPLSQPAALRI